MFIFSRRSFIIGALSIPLTIPALRALPGSIANSKDVDVVGSVHDISGHAFEKTSSDLRIRSWESSNKSSPDEKYVTFPASWKTGW
ncbi:hypothetical protein [Polynucleobacter sp.]|uniref:hypothetical protein n=1 Tax=Polynucleobacter sp. TaxID=2029855 RepID=UPI003F69D44A